MKRIAWFALVMVVGCGGPEPLAPPPKAAAKKVAPAAWTSAEAMDRITNSPEFSEYEFTKAAYTLTMQRSTMNSAMLQAAKDLAAAGWVAFDGAGTMVLKPKAKDDVRFLVRTNGTVDIVPLARKEIMRVDAVRDGAVDFTWHWLPNEIGVAFRSGEIKERYEGEKHATATLQPIGQQWMVLRIEPKK